MSDDDVQFTGGIVCTDDTKLVTVMVVSVFMSIKTCTLYVDLISKYKKTKAFGLKCLPNTKSYYMY